MRKTTKTYGKIEYIKEHDLWRVLSLEPHVSIKLKALLPKISEFRFPPFDIPNTPDTSIELEWFFLRYPLEMNSNTKKELKKQAKEYTDKQIQSEAILLPDYKPKGILGLKDGHEFRKHQLIAAELLNKVERYLLVDALGSGKTYSAIAAALQGNNLPAAFVVQSHLSKQFADKISEITNLKVHVIKSKKLYSLPKADVYIFKYSFLSSWVDIFSKSFFNLAIFDEIQELRHGTTTSKGEGAKVLSNFVQKVLATTATPVYGYGIEFFNIFDIIKEGALGSRNDFLREWCIGDDKKIRDTKAFGTYLRDNLLMLKRSREEIYGKKESAQIIPEKVDYDPEIVKSTEDLAKQLALKTLNSNIFTERGQAARQLDIQLRRTTGLSKAKNVAHFVRMLVETGEKVLLSGWHRDVYDIWQKELKDLGVVMYTGSESPAAKQRAKDEFTNGDANVMIISHVSGAGLDGLQYSCSTVVIGELAWSEEIHKQIIGRVDRDGQEKQVFAFVLMSDYGSDPVIQSILNIKYQQQESILNPDKEAVEVEVDEKRMVALAKSYLKGIGVSTEKTETEE